MFLHNIKIRSKLFMAFGLFIVLMVVSSALSLFSQYGYAGHYYQ